MRYFFILLTTLCAAGPIRAQTAEDSVKAVINTLFTAMRTGDAALFKTTFADSAILQTIARNKEGKTIIRSEGLADFAAVVGKLKKDSADERIRFETVKIDGPMAIAWTPYQFYYNGQFSHCGVNSFQLVRFNGVWKIQYLIDTRRRDGCL
ncbi:MAG: nuclear transport factor 2 family protein [Chitinophagaceae bacterium]